jgi:dihydroorotate dehydrogenase (NAD+) catalytic subunit
MTALSLQRWGIAFQNPVFLAAGTCGFGEELREVVDLEALGGIVTKSVTVEPRKGNPAPRVAEVGPAMINSIGLANPGLDKVRAEKLPWIRANLRRAKVFVSVAGRSAKDYWTVIEGLDGEDGFVGFELNLSCPNDMRLERPFALDPDAVAEVTAGAKKRTQRPVLIKLAPNDPDLASTVRRAESAGADGLTLVNTLPGMALDSGKKRPVLGAGQGGLSGPGLRGTGLLAVATARKSVSIPLVGVGGIGAANDALEYMLAGASLVQIGTASFADPRTAERVVSELGRWVAARKLKVDDLIGAGVPRPASAQTTGPAAPVAVPTTRVG